MSGSHVDSGMSGSGAAGVTGRVSPSLALAAVSLTAFFVGLSSTMLSVAVPAIVRHFQAGALAAVFVILAPSVTSTALMLSMGRIGDLVGRRNVYLAALGAFTVASLLAAVAPSVWLLIALEACQAIGTAAIWANNAALVLELVPQSRANHALGLYFASISVSQLIGPSVGGAIAGTLGWRWIFLLSVPVGIISLLACRAVLPAAQAAAGPAGRPSREHPGADRPRRAHHQPVPQPDQRLADPAGNRRRRRRGRPAGLLRDPRAKDPRSAA